MHFLRDRQVHFAEFKKKVKWNECGILLPIVSAHFRRKIFFAQLVNGFALNLDSIKIKPRTQKPGFRLLSVGILQGEIRFGKLVARAETQEGPA